MVGKRTVLSALKADQMYEEGRITKEQAVSHGAARISFCTHS